MKRVLITGGISGMGLSATKFFLERGWRVMIVDLNEEKGNDLINQLKEEGYKEVYFYKCNIAKDADVKLLYEYTIETLGGIDSVINNAGIWVVGILHETTEDDWNRLFKGAVVNMVKAMALDYRKYNIRVNNVCPAACAIPMFLANPQKVIDLFNEANPLKRICTPDEVAKAMYFLASDESSSCNGINLEVSGWLNIHTGQPIQ